MTTSFVCRTESPRRSGERAVGGVTSGLIWEGQEVTWRARHFGIPLTMTSRITRLDFPRSFTDEQVKGPFKAFRHVHDFVATATGSTMVDRVEFTAPLGVLGRAVERLFLARYLARLIAQRGGFLADADRRIN